MQVSSISSQVAFRAKDKALFENQPKSNSGIFEKSREAWKGTLKTYEGAKAYTGGIFRGIRNAIYAGAALVILDWFGTSIANIAKGKQGATTWNMIKTPFVLAGQALSRSTKYFIEFCKKDGPTIPQFLKTALIDTPIKVMKKIYRSPNISKFTRIGLPIVTLIALGGTIIRSKLDYNEQAAKIDHRYKGVHGHRDKN